MRPSRCASAPRRPRARRAPQPAPCSRRPAPRPATRSASTSSRDGPWSSAATRCSSPARTWTASAPWPASGTNSAGSNRKPIRSPSPSRSSPAAASTMASASPSSSLRSRVSTLPRSGTTSRSGRSSPSRPPRRADEVPTRAPAGSSAREPNGPQQASRASSRGGIAPITRPSGIVARQILRAVHRHVDLPGQQRPLDLAGEDAAAVADLLEPEVAPAVAGRVDLDQLRAVQLRRDQPRLGERQPAAPRAHPDHRAGGAGSSPNRSLMASA